MKGRIAWVFWLVIVLAVLTSTASYAWLAMNTVARLRGFEVELESDSIYLEISADAAEGYGKQVVFDRVRLLSDEQTHEIYLISYGEVPEAGAYFVYSTQIDESNARNYGTDGKYTPSRNQRFYLKEESALSNSEEKYYNYVDITDTLSDGDSIIGYHAIAESGRMYQTATASEEPYYVKNKNGEKVDYSCIGEFEENEQIAGRIYWGYAYSTDENDAQKLNSLNVVSVDTPPEKYCLEKTVFLRGAANTGDATGLRASVEIKGRKNQLTEAMRIMFVAESDSGKTATVVYSHRDKGSFDGKLFDLLKGDQQEIVKVSMYIFFDGRDDDAHNTTDFLTINSVNVTFTVDDHVYNQ